MWLKQRLQLASFTLMVVVVVVWRRQCQEQVESARGVSRSMAAGAVRSVVQCWWLFAGRIVSTALYVGLHTAVAQPRETVRARVAKASDRSHYDAITCSGCDLQLPLPAVCLSANPRLVSA